MYRKGSPDKRPKASGAMDKFSPSKKSQNVKERYMKKPHGSPSKMTHDSQSFEAKKILDQHINEISRDCYYYYRDAIARHDETALGVLRNYRHHENSDQLISNMTLNFNSREMRPKT